MESQIDSRVGVIGSGDSASATLRALGLSPAKAYESSPKPGARFCDIDVEPLSALDLNLDQLLICTQWWREIVPTVVSLGFPISRTRVFVAERDRPDFEVKEILDFVQRPDNDPPVLHTVKNSLLPQMPGFDNRFDGLRLAISSAPAGGIWMEFGVFRGETLKFIQQLSGREVFGFDSGVGYARPETENLAFHGPTSLPSWLTESRHYIEGWFDQTLPKFLGDSSDEIAFIHYDAGDLEPARYVLNTVFPRLANGAIIAFDEILASDATREAISPEWVAFHEAIASHDFEYSWLCRSGIRGVVRIHP